MVITAGVRAQVPADLARVEVARSRECVGILARVAGVEGRLAPLAERSQRLSAVAEAVALEERSVIDSLDATDPLESRVRQWFLTDGELAERLVVARDSALAAQRAAGRDTIEAALGEAMRRVQAAADSILASTGTLPGEAAECNGAVFVRGAVLEACATTPSPLCEAARDTAAQRGLRFVESAEALWDIEELRAWTDPGPLQVTPTGQLVGARTGAQSRTGNAVVTLVLAPRMEQRDSLAPGEAEHMKLLADSLGFGDAHPEVVFVPSLGVGFTVPAPLGGETGYLLHFGGPDEPEVLLTLDAGTGPVIEGVVDLGPGHLSRLAGGEPLTITAFRGQPSAPEPIYSIGVSALNQPRAVTALTGYMSGRLGADLQALFPPDA